MPNAGAAGAGHGAAAGRGARVLRARLALELAEEPVCHYHRKTTEIYVILEGEGHLELDGELVAVRPLSAVMIRPGCRHRGVGRLKLLNISVPGFDAEDFYQDEQDVGEGDAVPVH